MLVAYDGYWNVDDIVIHVAANGAAVELDNDGQVTLHTGLFQHSDGTLHDAPEHQ